MVEKLNLKLGIDYLPRRAALPAANRVVLPIAMHTRVCARGGWTPWPCQGAAGISSQRDAGAVWARYRVLPCLLDLLAAELEPSVRLCAPLRDSWAEILLSRFG